ncbi:MAG TPA: aldehyde dehydrogenase family protein, partial [Gemmatimonadaceae bacterium]|nr:aldehyde dehydrogenase family protein [Gemmatimonadaceae bacterium]
MTATAPARLRHLVAGTLRASASDETIASVNPSDRDDVLSLVPVGDATDVRLAVEAAQAALPGWRDTSGPARARLLHDWAAVIDARAGELADAMVREVGKPIAEARGEVARCIVLLRYYAGEAVREIGEVIPAQQSASLQFTLREPLGVVALITPWNFPLAIPLWKAAPALAFGNTVVLKPSELSSFTASLLGETAMAAGIPAGVFNLVYGSGVTVGEPLIECEAVRAVSFTGSTRVGARVAALAAGRNIRFQTEMGGKNVAIVLPDADVEQAAALVAGGAMRFAGQKCTATSRVVVAGAVEEAFLAALRRQVEGMPLGPVTDPAAAVGPMITAAARDGVSRTLVEADAEPLFSIPVPANGGYERGNFLAPTVVRGAADADLAQRELFAPVLWVLRARDVDEAISIANGTRYGLSASLFTRDLRSALSYIRRIEAGMVRVNGDTTGVDPHAPFGGVKGSSSGSREQGPAAREF